MWLHIVCNILQQVRSSFQSELSTDCNIVQPFSVYSIFFFPWGHLLAAYVFLDVYPSLYLSLNSE